MVENEQAREAYLECVRAARAEADVVSGPRALHERLVREAYSGLLVDLPTLIKAPHADKCMVRKDMELYPVLRLRYDEGERKVRGLFYGQESPDGDVVAQFIRQELGAVSPRLLRASPRRKLNFNALVCRGDVFDPENALRTVTLDVSRGGCFLVTCEEFPPGAEICLRFLELGDPAPMRAVLRRRVEWGKSMAVPGIGVEFLDLSEEQRKALDTWLARRRFFAAEVGEHPADAVLGDLSDLGELPDLDLSDLGLADPADRADCAGGDSGRRNGRAGRPE